MRRGKGSNFAIKGTAGDSLLKKKKRGTTLKPPKRPCEKCKKVEACTFERDYELYLNNRWTPSGRQTACKRYLDYLKKSDRFIDQDHVSQRERLQADAPVVCLEGVPGEENKYIDGFQYRMDQVSYELWMQRQYAPDEPTEIDRVLPDGWPSFSDGWPNIPKLSNLNNRLLELKHNDELTYREIARVVNGGRNPKTAINLTVKAVERRLARAHKKLGGIFSYNRGEH